MGEFVEITLRAQSRSFQSVQTLGIIAFSEER
jgi:hypothetical protein